MAMIISSTAFAPNGLVPVRYTCDGPDISPPLQWSGVPAEARSLVLMIEDPDAPDPESPKTVWVHWIVYNIPTSAHGLAENAASRGLPSGALQGLNDWGRPDYGGPCPPVGSHRYFHRLYALDVVLPDLGQPRKSALLHAMRGRILAEASLIGCYAHRAGGTRRVRS